MEPVLRQGSDRISVSGTPQVNGRGLTLQAHDL